VNTLNFINIKLLKKLPNGVKFFVTGKRIEVIILLSKVLLAAFHIFIQPPSISKMEIFIPIAQGGKFSLNA
jgi:hypothetical protein